MPPAAEQTQGGPSFKSLQSARLLANSRAEGTGESKAFSSAEGSNDSSGGLLHGCEQVTELGNSGFEPLTFSV